MYTLKAKESIARNSDSLLEASGRDQLMGFEGASAMSWFSLLKDILSPEWQFSGRNKRPPKDPMNALFSLSYTMATADVYKTVHERGMDPCIGFLHAARPGRDSFVLDVLEPLRPGADQFCLTLANTTMHPEQFTQSDHEGCRINNQGRRLYFNNWSQWRSTWPYIISQSNLDTEDDDEDDYYESSEENPFINKDSKSIRICCLQIINEVTQCFKQMDDFE